VATVEHTERPTVAPAAAATEFRAALPALDGYRGLGMIVVLLYHQNFSWFPNGVLVISMFFTLSGYLLGRLAVNEVQRSGRIQLGRFWTRRVRRLMPASLVVIIGVSVASWIWPDPTRPLSRGDVISGVTYWENWHLYATDSRYEAINGIASPLLHLWSLSLEEQVFLAFPVLMLCALVWPATRRFGPTIIAALVVVGFALGPVFERRGISSAYYATPVRMAEFLCGVLLAVLLGQRPAMVGRLRALAGRAGWEVVFAIVVVAEVVWWTTVSITSADLFPWGVVVSSVLTCALMVVAETHSLAERALSWRPICWLGVRVYGVYLVHWPVFRFLDADATGLQDWPLFVLRVAVTLALSEAMLQLFENPVRVGRMWSGSRVYLGSAALAAAALGIGTVAASAQPAPIVDTEAIALQRIKLAGLAELPADAPTRSTTDPELPARILVVGDSQAYTLAGGLGPWAADAGVRVEYNSGVGCGIGGVTPIRYLGLAYDAAPGCAEFAEFAPLIVDRVRPNVVIVIGGLGDLSDRILPGDSEYSHIGEPDYDAWLNAELDRFVAEIAPVDAQILWLTHPDVNVPVRNGATGEGPFVENDPVRMARYNDLIRVLPERHPSITVGEFAAEAQTLPGGQFNSDVRPDGTHFEFSRAPQLIDWVTEQVRALAAVTNR
jgi:peptidoglycan/LPS O-acetylase OafA/YrhL